ncbi:hypothetical protein SO694_00069047 [Aureococcus anophagefferens]|uniref:UvrD-like helicase ATP-binding domain-containing protein n=1 Tax=Aureococcus anophagefferens TaxID=44056 RepID=A0ABR1FPZ0_AURAN
MAEDPAMQADPAGADLHLLAALSAVWSEPLQRLYDQSPNARQMLDFVMVKNRSLGFGGKPAAPWTRKMDVAAATLRRRLRVLAAARGAAAAAAASGALACARTATRVRLVHGARGARAPVAGPRCAPGRCPRSSRRCGTTPTAAGASSRARPSRTACAAEAVDEADGADDDADEAGDAAGDDASAPPPAPPAQGLGGDVLWTKHAPRGSTGRGEEKSNARARRARRRGRLDLRDGEAPQGRDAAPAPRGQARPGLAHPLGARATASSSSGLSCRTTTIIGARGRSTRSSGPRSPSATATTRRCRWTPGQHAPLLLRRGARRPARLVAGDWTPPMALTAPERAVVVADAPSATLLLGRSGTGKTICTVSRMLDASGSRARRASSPRGRGASWTTSAACSSATATTGRRWRRSTTSSRASRRRRPTSGAARVSFPAVRDDLWQRAATKGGGLGDALTAWTQIRSFLKGSAEAVVKGAALEEADFLAEAFNNRTRLRSADDRRDACRIRARYDRELADRGLWDDADRARAVAARLLADRGAGVRRVYADEVQDSTQAELMVLALACGGDAARLWLAGDTAQAVTYGVHFRFAEVRSALYRCCEAAARSLPPQRVTKLTANYRAHGGVLDVAAAVLDALLGAFPEALDRLPRDEAMARPRPAVAVGDEGRVAALLAADERYVVVAHDEQRDALRAKFPEPTTILGVRDAKGLEFSHAAACGLLLFCEAKTPAGGAFARWLLDRDLAEKFTPPRDDERVFLTRDERGAPRGPRGPRPRSARRAAPRRRGGLRARRRRAAAAAARGAHAAAALADGADDGAVAAPSRTASLARARATPRSSARGAGRRARECRLAILQRCMVGDEARDAADALRDILDLDAQLGARAAPRSTSA